jgi:hypothetical protein
LQLAAILDVLVKFVLHQNLKRMKKEIHESAPQSAVYGLGFIGAAIYFISTASGFWLGVWGFFKAMLWPAFLVYELFKFLAA